MKKIIAAVVFSLMITGFSVNNASASVSCRQSNFGTSYFGQKYNCNDGTSMTIKPNLNGRYTDPWSSYRARDSYGNTYTCRYSNSLSSRYSCR
jgi:hypothetical protein